MCLAHRKIEARLRWATVTVTVSLARTVRAAASGNASMQSGALQVQGRHLVPVRTGPEQPEDLGLI